MKIETLDLEWDLQSASVARLVEDQTTPGQFVMEMVRDVDQPITINGVRFIIRSVKPGKPDLAMPEVAIYAEKS